MRKVKKAIIPVAGLGTRFLPATKTVPKEMLPIVDTPIILFIVEEAVKAGIEDIVLIAGRNKHAIEDFFDVTYELQDKLERDGKKDWVEMLLRIQNMANVVSIRQKQPMGLGHAVLCGAPIVGQEPFAVLLGDEIMIAPDGKPTVTEELAKTFEATDLSTVAVMEVPLEETHKYGIAECADVEAEWSQLRPQPKRIQKLIEKPSLGQTQSRWALPGRYVFDPAIFEYIRETKPGKNGEIQLTDAMAILAKNQGMLATEFSSKRFDAGDKLGFLQANIEVALERPELGDRLREYLQQLVKRI